MSRWVSGWCHAPVSATALCGLPRLGQHAHSVIVWAWSIVVYLQVTCIGVSFHLFWTPNINLPPNCSDKWLSIFSCPTAFSVFRLFFPSRTLFRCSQKPLPDFSTWDFRALIWDNYSGSFLSLVICCSAGSSLPFRKIPWVFQRTFYFPVFLPTVSRPLSWFLFPPPCFWSWCPIVDTRMKWPPVCLTGDSHLWELFLVVILRWLNFFQTLCGVGHLKRGCVRISDCPQVLSSPTLQASTPRRETWKWLQECGPSFVQWGLEIGSAGSGPWRTSLRDSSTPSPFPAPQPPGRCSASQMQT